MFVDPAVHGRGIGTDAVRTLAAHLVDVEGHHRLTIDPAVDNAAAIRYYTKVGFRPVGIMRQYDVAPTARSTTACTWTCWPRSWGASSACSSVRLRRCCHRWERFSTLGRAGPTGRESLTPRRAARSGRAEPRGPVGRRAAQQ